jgi:hypothetical protein
MRFLFATFDSFKISDSSKYLAFIQKQVHFYKTSIFFRIIYMQEAILWQALIK